MLQIGQKFSLIGLDLSCRDSRYYCAHWKKETGKEMETSPVTLLCHEPDYIIIKLEGGKVYFDLPRNSPEYRTAYIMNAEELMHILGLEQEEYSIY